MTDVECVCAMIDAMNVVGHPYMLVGSLSSNMYGIPRMTKDADFVMQVGPTTVERIMRAVGNSFRLDPQISFETITGTTRYRVSHVETDFTIEFFELSADPHDQQRFARRKQAMFEGRPVFVASAEDVVITKLRWSKGGDRRKDVDDVENVLAVQEGQLDLAYIRGWCDKHGTRELLDRLLVSAAR